MFITFSDGYTFHFVKNVNDGKNEIVIIKDGRYYGGMKDINKNRLEKDLKEIESAIDTINMAFENLLDSLFQDMAWDISSDISVMKTMLAQDGLTTEGQGVAMQMKR